MNNEVELEIVTLKTKQYYFMKYYLLDFGNKFFIVYFCGVH